MSEDKILSSWVDSLLKAVGLISGISLLCSIAYDWGYLYALGLSFSDIPTSLADHIRSSLNWLPTVFFIGSAVFLFELLTIRIEQGMTEEEIIKSSSKPEFVRKLRKSPVIVNIILSIILSILVLMSYVLLGEIEGVMLFLGFSLIVLWLCFSYFIHNHPRILQRRSPALIFAIHWLPPIIIWMAFMGYHAAIPTQNKSNPAHKVYLKNNSLESIDVSLIRLFDKGILMKTQKETPVVFIGWDSVSKIEVSPGKKERFKGILCMWFNVCILE
ncbi:MAG: hypothetical protein WA162_01510 [Thermodesulfobacteriota bacterium]